MFMEREEENICCLQVLLEVSELKAEGMSNEKKVVMNKEGILSDTQALE